MPHFNSLERNTRRRRWHPTPVLLPGKSHGRRRLVGCSPWGHEESDTTEQLPFHSSNMLICHCVVAESDTTERPKHTHTHTHTHTHRYTP